MPRGLHLALLAVACGAAAAPASAFDLVEALHIPHNPEGTFSVHIDTSRSSTETDQALQSDAQSADTTS